MWQHLTYSNDQQQIFACLAGDYNPMHVDPVAARRTLAGGQAVHGMHQVLSVMEWLFSKLQEEKQPERSVTSFSAKFQKPLLVDDRAVFRCELRKENEYHITLLVEEEPISKINLYLGAARPVQDVQLPNLKPEPMVELHFPDMAGHKGSIPVGLDVSLAQKLFPLTSVRLGLDGIADVVGFNRLVGMHCPGLHSVFGQATIRFQEATGLHTLDYEVESADERFNCCVLRVKGRRTQGKLQVFVRPPPQAQPIVVEVSRFVQPDSFKGTRALIAGGSRGLGEITAKIIAAGGGVPIITYFRGMEDAESVAREIKAFGGQCETLSLDALHLTESLREIMALPEAPNSLYYFATPKIGLRKGFFSQEMLTRYQQVYVTAFGQLVDALAHRVEKLKVFYPSTVFVTERPREMAEYAIAKQSGEDLCAFYNKYSHRVKITVKRLPKIRTDQTSSLIPSVTPPADALEVMLPIVAEVENSL